MHSNRHLRRCFKIVALAVALYFAPFTGLLHAQTPFYQGKTLTVINGNEPGGTADQRMRAVLPFFKKHIPGSPTVVAEYMPGGRWSQGRQSYLRRGSPGWSYHGIPSG